MRILPLLSLFLAAGTAAAQWPPRPKKTPQAPHPPQLVPAPPFAIPEVWTLPPDFEFDFDFDFDSHAFALDDLRFELEELTPFAHWPEMDELRFQLEGLDHTPFPVEVEVPVMADLPMEFPRWTPEPPFVRPGHPEAFPDPGFPEPPMHPEAQDTPGDSLYRLARETLNRGEYRRASELFQSFEQRFPSSRYVQAALYWQAFALYRVGIEQDLRRALQVLERQRERYPNAAQDRDASELYTRVAGALAARGDAEAAARLRAGAAQAGQACDREDLSVRAEALRALVQADPAGSRALLRRVLARKDECSAPLRRQAVYLLAHDGGADVTAELLEVARNDPNDDVRRDALSALGRQPGEEASRALQELFGTIQDEKTQRAVLEALSRHGSESARQFVRRAIEREELSESLRAEAIRRLHRHRVGVAVEAARVASARRPGVAVWTPRAANEATLSEEDAAYLRGLYARTSSRTIKGAVLETLARSGGKANDVWLMDLVRNQNEDLRYRNAALSRLRRSDVPIEELTSLYDALTERDLLASIISVLGEREEPAATDKLIAIARTGTDPSIRRQAIAALSRKNDPRTTKLLLELLEP